MIVYTNVVGQFNDYNQNGKHRVSCADGIIMLYEIVGSMWSVVVADALQYYNIIMSSTRKYDIFGIWNVLYYIVSARA